MAKKTKGIVLALICITLWALIPVVAKLGQTSLDNHQFLFWSSLVSFVILLCLAAIKGNLMEIAHYSVGDWFQLSILGLLGTYFYYLFLYLGYASTSGLTVLVFQYSWPILIVLFSAFILKEVLTFRKAITLLLGFTGVVVVLTGGRFDMVTIENPGSISLVVTGAACFALYSVLSKTVRKDPLTAVTIYFMCAGMASLASMLLFSEFSFPSEKEIVPVVLNGLFINGISYSLWLFALRSTEASYLAPFTFITPALSALYLVVFFNEPLTTALLIGLLCIVAGGLVNSLNLKRLAGN